MRHWARYCIGGSHAQRDVLHLTLLQAVEHIRRPPRRLPTRQDRRDALIGRKRRA
jgi:hypothetical protein